MSPRLGRGDDLGRDHARARDLAAARLGETISPDDAGWLAGHLAWCAPCRAVSAEYESQRISLRSLRMDAPVPPRDLWARTAAALESEERARPVSARGARRDGGVRGRQPLPVAPLAGLLVVAVAVGFSMLNGIPLIPRQGSGSPAPGTAGPGATPFLVTAREVPLVRRTADGTLVLQVGRVDEVCPLDTDDCAGATTMDRREIGRIAAGDASDVLLSPTGSHLVVLDRSTSSGGVYVVAMADLPGPSASPAVTPGPDVSSDPTAAPSPTPPAEPTASPDAQPTPSSPAPEPPASPTPSPTPEPTATASVDPGEPTPPPATEPPIDVSPEPGGPVSIAEDVVLVGAVAGYSSDGNALAFTARPSDGSHGPDVFVWRPGEAHALAVTGTHDVLFAGWIGSRLLVSRAIPSTDGTTAAPTTFILDPATGGETPVTDADMWRPAVDPLARGAVWWEGTLAIGADSYTWRPADGRLVIGGWPGAPAASPEPSPDPDAASPAAIPAAPVILADGPMLDWQVRWDETGSRIAVWISHEDDPSTGLLSLYLVDPATGLIADGEPLLRDAVAREGFSLGAGRLAWTAPTADGGTDVQVLAWSAEGMGKVRISPEDELVVVR